MLIIGTLFIFGSLALLFVMLDLVRPAMAPASMRTRRRPMRASGASVFVDDEITSLGRFRLLTTPFLIDRAKRNIALAGNKAGWTIRRLMLVKVVAASLMALAMVLLFSSHPSGRMLVVFVIATGSAFLYPDFWLDGRAQDRQKEIERELPDLLDQTVIAIESGLSFEAALQRVADAGSGPLAEEFRRTLQDMRLGMTRRAAYYALSTRTSMEDLKRFCKQIIQAEEFGVSMSTVVRNLAKEMRIKRRYRAEEIAQKIPVKIIFPLATCFLPVLFIIVLYPTFRGLIGAIQGS